MSTNIFEENPLKTMEQKLDLSRFLISKVDQTSFVRFNRFINEHIDYEATSWALTLAVPRDWRRVGINKQLLLTWKKFL